MKLWGKFLSGQKPPEKLNPFVFAGIPAEYYDVILRAYEDVTENGAAAGEYSARLISLIKQRLSVKLCE